MHGRALCSIMAGPHVEPWNDGMLLSPRLLLVYIWHVYCAAFKCNDDMMDQTIERCRKILWDSTRLLVG